MMKENKYLKIYETIGLMLYFRCTEISFALSSQTVSNPIPVLIPAHL